MSDDDEVGISSDCLTIVVGSRADDGKIGRCKKGNDDEVGKSSVGSVEVVLKVIVELAIVG